MPIKPHCLNCKMGCIHEITISSFLVPLLIEKKRKKTNISEHTYEFIVSRLWVFDRISCNAATNGFCIIYEFCTYMYKKVKAGHFNYQNSPYIFYSNIFATLNDSIEITGNNVIERKLTQLLKPEKFRIFCGKDINSTYNHHSHSSFNYHPNNLIWTIIQKTISIECE